MSRILPYVLVPFLCSCFHCSGRPCDLGTTRAVPTVPRVHSPASCLDNC
jgi:hypothetical protein